MRGGKVIEAETPPLQFGGLHFCSLGEVTTHAGVGLCCGETVWGPPTAFKHLLLMCL